MSLHFCRLKIVAILTNFFRSVIALTPAELVQCVYLCINKVSVCVHACTCVCVCMCVCVGVWVCVRKCVLWVGVCNREIVNKRFGEVPS